MKLGKRMRTLWDLCVTVMNVTAEGHGSIVGPIIIILGLIMFAMSIVAFYVNWAHTLGLIALLFALQFEWLWLSAKLNQRTVGMVTWAIVCLATTTKIALTGHLW